jgi:hypothetical protein
MKRIVLSLAMLLLCGCMAATSIQFDYKPRVVRLPGTTPGDPALVLGQAYMSGYGNWVQLIITSIDDAKTGDEKKLRPTVNFLVPPGQRTVRVKTLLGNSMTWKEAKESVISQDLLAGRVYQVKAREATDIHGTDAVDLWLEQLGSIAEYQYFIKRNPDYKQGQPLTRGQMTGLP